jgi:hypothetical protein
VSIRGAIRIEVGFGRDKLSSDQSPEHHLIPQRSLLFKKQKRKLSVIPCIVWWFEPCLFPGVDFALLLGFVPCLFFDLGLPG